MHPVATYRLQLHAGFRFDDAAAIADYLRGLGISHLYCSPYLQAAKGSTHGYDVVDHSRVSDDLGGIEAHARFCDVLGRNELGQVLDIVPNHMAIGTRENKWWWDVLENGPSSQYASYFDVEWDPPESKLKNLMLLPVLGDHYGRVLEDGELKLTREGGSFVISYFDTVLPVAPRSMSDLLARAAERCDSDELGFAADSLRALPLATATDRVSLARRHRDKEVLRRQMARLCEQEDVARAIQEVLDETNANPDELDAILARQNYRVAYWRTAGRELSYRRFFDINTLVGVRIEDRHVFRDTHRLLIDWLRAGVIDGLRVDHPDGLRDPGEYFRRLRRSAPNAWIVAEKILEPGEALRSDWDVSGTTGYDFLHLVGSLFTDPAGEEPLSLFYTEFTTESSNFADVARDRKHQVLRGMLGSDVNRLTAHFMEVCERHRRHRDHTRHDIHHAVREVVACFPVYRTYVQAELREVQEDDRRYIGEAIAEAKRRRPDLPPDLFDFLSSVLLLEVTGDVESEFVMRFQQFSGPAMAKGVEDTTFYVFNRLSSLNEVGGDPAHFGIAPQEFHRCCEERQRLWPSAMLATSTHDTKRSEDVRMRLHLLSEIPEQWSAAVRQWSQLTGRYGTGGWPDRNMEYLFYQTLVGAWPIDLERIEKYMEKASREAKTHTSWTDPNNDYDAVLKRFVHGAMGDAEFLTAVEEFVKPLVQPGRNNSLAQTLIKFTAPGVPDIYQGCEIWDLSLVDPDNRRPVDYSKPRELLDQLDGLTVEQIRERGDEGLPKLWVTRQALRLRRSRPRAFSAESCYKALEVHGSASDHAVAFVRGREVISVAPRLTMRLAGDWGTTTVRLPEGSWRNELTGDRLSGDVAIRTLLERFPVALLALEGIQ